MLTTYKALLHGNQLEWVDDVPTHIASADSVPVHITILDAENVHPTTQTPGQRMAEALEQLANAEANSEIKDPLAWEREVRQERALPGRED